MTAQDNVEAFTNIGRALGALHTAMVEFGMRRDDANLITSTVVAQLFSTVDMSAAVDDNTVIRCGECDGGWVVDKPEIHVATCSRYKENMEPT